MEAGRQAEAMAQTHPYVTLEAGADPNYQFEFFFFGLKMNKSKQGENKFYLILTALSHCLWLGVKRNYGDQSLLVCLTYFQLD